jgi:mannose-6-phosphate isomerase-like protein (cupin superfamily)
MKYQLTKNEDIPKKDKHGIHLNVYPQIGDCGIVTVNTEAGHNQEFYDVESTFTYIVLEGDGVFVLDDEEVLVSAGDHISIPPKVRIHYKGNMKLVLITNPAWKAENEVETKPTIW